MKQIHYGTYRGTRKIANKFQEEYKTNLKKYDKKGAIESLKKKKYMKDM